MRRILVASAVVLGASGLGVALLAPRSLAVPNRTAREAIHFAGLQRAYQCFPGAMRPRERRPAFLSWKTASGGGTPKSEFVYEIFMSRTSGGENFARPNWTTEGHLSFETPKLPPSRYFVVRARDKEGHHDHNRVELQAKSPCV